MLKAKTKMKKWKIPVSWEVIGYIEIEAETLEDALDIADKTIDELPLPENGEYEGCSFRIEHESAYDQR